MTIVKKLLIISSILLIFTLSFVGCSSGNPDSIDRIVVGQLNSIDVIGEYATLYFADGLNLTVTYESLTHFSVEPLFFNVKVYNLHHTEKSDRFSIMLILNPNILFAK